MERVIVLMGLIFSLSATHGKVLPHGSLIVQVGNNAVFRWTAESQINEVVWKLKNVTSVYRLMALKRGSGILFNKNSAKYNFVGSLTLGHAWFRLNNVRVEDTGNYIAQIKESGEEESTNNEVQLTVAVTPKFVEKPESTTFVIENTGLKINCSATGPPKPNVTLVEIKEGNIIPKAQGIGSVMLRESDITTSSEGRIFVCQARNNPNQYPVNVTTTITVYYRPQFTTVPNNATVQKGNSVLLKCKATSRPPATIQWSRENNKPLNPGFSQSNGILTILTASKSDAGKYICTAGNIFGGQHYNVTADAYVVVEYPPTIVCNSSEHTVNLSGSLMLTCKADGIPVPTITWTKSPGNIKPPNSGDTYIISHVNKSDAGTYTCTASNGIGNAATANIKVIVQFKPTIDKDQSNSSVESWNNNEITLTCKWSSSRPAPKWSWYKPDGTNITSSAQSINQGSKIKVNTRNGDYGLYKCKATNVAGFDEHKINVTQLFPPGPPSFNVTDIEASSAVIRWTEPVNNGGSKVTAYKVEIDSKIHHIGLTPNHFTIPGLTKNKVYVVKLYAKNIVGYGNASSKTFTTKKQGPPASPVIKIVEFSPTTVTLSWTKPEENGGEIINYTIYKKVAGNKEWTQVGELAGDTLVYTVKDLLPGKTYSFLVTANNKDGDSLKDVNVETVTLPTLPTTPPPTTTAAAPPKGKRSDDESDPNQPIIIAGAVVAVVLIVITAVISVIILRKKKVFGRSGKRNQSSQQSAAYHNDVVSSDSLDRGAAVVNLNDDSVPTYAAVDMSKKTKKKDEIPNYAAVDKTKKKKKPGEIIYAELADFNTNNAPLAVRPAEYTSTDYADISQFQNQNEPEPTYANFPGRSKDYNI